MSFPGLELLKISTSVTLKSSYEPCLIERFAFASLYYRTTQDYRYRNGPYPSISALVLVAIPTSRKTVDVHLQSFVPYTTSDRVGLPARYT